MRLFVNGVARKVAVDDRFPLARDGRLMTSHTTHAQELWVSIIEKAYMKVSPLKHLLHPLHPLHLLRPLHEGERRLRLPWLQLSDRHARANRVGTTTTRQHHDSTTTALPRQHHTSSPTAACCAVGSPSSNGAATSRV